MQYIHNETGHPIKLIRKGIVKNGKKHVLIQSSAGRSSLKPQKKFFKDFKEEPFEVFINLNNSQGKDIHAVIAVRTQDLWLASCSSKEEAEQFIKNNNFECVRFIDTRTGE